jgi:hypothetical protein
MEAGHTQSLQAPRFDTEQRCPGVGYALSSPTDNIERRSTTIEAGSNSHSAIPCGRKPQRTSPKAGGVSGNRVVIAGPVQVNFIRGGLILTFVGQHNVMDMAGQATIINWLSRACHNLLFSVEELSIGNMDKSKSVPLLDDLWEPGPKDNCARFPTPIT